MVTQRLENSEKDNDDDSVSKNRHKMALAPISRIPRLKRPSTDHAQFNRSDIVQPVSKLEQIRDQFRKRRETIANTENVTLKHESSGLKQYFEDRRKSYKLNANDKFRQNSQPKLITYQKNSAGRDKSNPLTPILHNKNPTSNNHNNESKYSDDTTKQNGSPFSQKASLLVRQQARNSSKQKAKQPKYLELTKNVQFNSDSENEQNLNMNNGHHNGHHNGQNGRTHTNYQNPSEKTNNPPKGRSQKLSDFERWQIEQDANDERRRRQRAANPIAVAKRIDAQMRKTPPLPTPPPPEIYSSRSSEKNKLSHREEESSLCQYREESIGTASSNESSGYDEEAELIARIQRGQEELEKMKQSRMKRRADEEKKRLKSIAQTRLQSISRMSAESDDNSLPYEEITPKPPVGRQQKKAKKRVHSSKKRAPTPPPPTPPPLTPPPDCDFPSVACLAPPTLPERVAYRPNDNSTTATFYAQRAMNDQDSQQHVEMEQCDMCGRNFSIERLAQHANICQKVIHKTRSTFDPSKMRRKGTELENYQKSSRTKSTQQSDPKSNNWRKKHEEFMNSMKYARKVKAIEANGGKLSDLPPPPKSDVSHYKQCPYCDRKFDKDVADRHIPKCKDMKHNKALSKPTSKQKRKY